MKKVLFSAFVMALFAIGFTASDDEKRDSVAHEDVPTKMETVNVEQMLLDLNQNEMRAQKKYADKWFEIVGRLGGMDSEGEYFSLVGEAFSMVSVHCKIPKDKREELTDILAYMNKGETIAVKGKVIDMGEIMGYDVSIVEVYRTSSKGTAKVIEQVAESMIDATEAAIASNANTDDIGNESDDASYSRNNSSSTVDMNLSGKVGGEATLEMQGESGWYLMTYKGADPTKRTLELESYNSSDGQCVLNAYLKGKYIGKFVGRVKTENGSGTIQTYEGIFESVKGAKLDFYFHSN